MSAELINHSTPIAELVVNTDGGSRGNPGHSAIGVVISTPDGAHIESFGRYIGIATNNIAEYTAVIDALEAIVKYQPKTVQFYLDSELVVKQLRGEYRVKNAELQSLHAEILKQTAQYEVSFGHVLRAKNAHADIEVNKALDEYLTAS
jgi:ribonuclease HI